MGEIKMKIGKRLIFTALVAFTAISLFSGTASVQAARNSISLIIATATPGGTFYPAGIALSTLWCFGLKKVKPAPIEVNPVTSAGSDENIHMLKTKKVDLAILQGLFGTMALNGTDIYEGKAFKELRSISMLWPNVEHFVIIQEKVKTGTIADIKGLRFSIGRINSGTRVSGLMIMGGLGMSEDDIKAKHLGYFPSASAMRAKQIDGANLAAGPPVAAVTDLFAMRGMKVKVLEFTDKQLEAVLEKTAYPGYRFVIPANTYPGQKKPVKSIAQPNFLGVRSDVDKEVVYQLTKTIYENLNSLGAVHKTMRHIRLDTAVKGLTVPLHPGALKYYKEVGLKIPDNLTPPEAK